MDKQFKILKIDHIAVAVKDINNSINIFTLLGMDCQDVEHVDNEKVNVIKINPESHDHTIELVEPSDNSSLIESFSAYQHFSRLIETVLVVDLIVPKHQGPPSAK